MRGFWNISTIIFIVCTALAQPIVADDETTDFRSLIDTMNQFRPNAQAGSGGVFGHSIGASIDTIYIDKESSYLSYHLGFKGPSKIEINRMHWQKGTHWPLDFGFALGQDTNQKITTWHSFLQWSFYEQLKRPSFILRGFYQQLYNFSDINALNTGLELGSSFSLFSFLSIIINGGIHQNQHHFKALNSDENLGLVRVNNQTYENKIIQSHIRYGAKIRLYFPFLHFHVEDQWRRNTVDFRREPTLSLHLGY